MATKTHSPTTAKKKSTGHMLTPAEAAPRLASLIRDLYLVGVGEHFLHSPSSPPDRDKREGAIATGSAVPVADSAKGAIATAGAVRTIKAGISRLPDRCVATFPECNTLASKHLLRAAHALLLVETESQDKIVVNFAFRFSDKKLREASKKADPSTYLANVIKPRLRKFSDYLFTIEDTNPIPDKDREDSKKAHVHGSFAIPRSEIEHLVDPIMGHFVGSAPLDGWTNKDIDIHIRSTKGVKKALEAALSAYFSPVLTTREDGYGAKFLPFAVFAVTNYGRGKYAGYMTEERDCPVFISQKLKKRTRAVYERIKQSTLVEIVHGLDLRPTAFVAALRAAYAAQRVQPELDVAGMARELVDRLLPIVRARRSDAIKSGKAIKAGADIEKIKWMTRTEVRNLAMSLCAEMLGIELSLLVPDPEIPPMPEKAIDSIRAILGIKPPKTPGSAVHDYDVDCNLFDDIEPLLEDGLEPEGADPYGIDAMVAECLKSAELLDEDAMLARMVDRLDKYKPAESTSTLKLKMMEILAAEKTWGG